MIVTVNKKYTGEILIYPKSRTNTIMAMSAMEPKSLKSKRDFCIHAVPFVTIYTLPNLRNSIKNFCAPSIKIGWVAKWFKKI